MNLVAPMGWAVARGSLCVMAGHQTQSCPLELRTGCFQTAGTNVRHKYKNMGGGNSVKLGFDSLPDTCSLAALNMGSWISVYILRKAL